MESQEAMNLCLFCGDGTCSICEAKKNLPEWFGGGTAQQEKMVRAGKHPLGWNLRKNEAYQTCGSCEYRYIVVSRMNRYQKCKLYNDLLQGMGEHGRGPGSDIRAKWAACEWWEQDDSGIPF